MHKYYDYSKLDSLKHFDQYKIYAMSNLHTDSAIFFSLEIIKFEHPPMRG